MRPEGVTPTTCSSNLIQTTGGNPEPVQTSIAPTPVTDSLTFTTAALFPPPAVTTVVVARSPTEDPRVGWIYDLNKSALITEMAKYGLETTGTSTLLRQRFVEFWKNSAHTDPLSLDNTVPRPGYLQTLGEGHFHPGVGKDDPRAIGQTDSFIKTQNPLSELNNEFTVVRELLGLSPNADSATVRRTLISVLPGRSPLAHPGLNDVNLGLPGHRAANSLPADSTRVTFSDGILRGIQADGFTTRNVRSDPRVSSQYGVTSNLGTSQNHECNLARRETNENKTASVCNIVRKWNLRYDGQRDPVSFLERLEELMEAYQIFRDDVLRAFPELLHGSALLWYRNSKETWNTYVEFKRSFETQFLPPGYGRNLDEEIRKRTQGENESFRNYVVAITTLIRRSGSYSEQAKLDLIYCNMRPEYKIMVRRQDCYSINTMIESAEDYESYVRDKNGFRPPPSPSVALVPDTAYFHKRRVDRSVETAVVERFPQRTNSFAKGTPVLKEVRQKGDGDEPSLTARNGRYNSFRRDSEDVNNRASSLGGRTERHVSDSRQGSRDQRDREAPLCWNCGERGHLARFCRRPLEPSCFYCNTKGVLTARCDCRSGNARLSQATGGHLSTGSTESAQPSRNGGKWFKSTRNFVGGVERCKDDQDPRPHVKVSLYNETFSALLDTGAVVNLIGEKVRTHVVKNGIVGRGPPGNCSALRLADGRTSIAKLAYSLDGIVGDKPHKWDALYVPSLTADLVLGIDTVQDLALITFNPESEIYDNARSSVPVADTLDVLANSDMEDLEAGRLSTFEHQPCITRKQKRNRRQRVRRPDGTFFRIRLEKLKSMPHNY